MATIFDGAGSTTVSLLSLGKAYSMPGIGLSDNARAMTGSYLESSTSALKTILETGLNTVDIAQTQILALRARIPESKLAPSLRAENASDGVSADTDLGSEIDTEA